MYVNSNVITHWETQAAFVYTIDFNKADLITAHLYLVIDVSNFIHSIF